MVGSHPLDGFAVAVIEFMAGLVELLPVGLGLLEFFHGPLVLCDIPAVRLVNALPRTAPSVKAPKYHVTSYNQTGHSYLQ